MDGGWDGGVYLDDAFFLMVEPQIEILYLRKFWYPDDPSL
jgi:hypothetical protein